MSYGRVFQGGMHAGGGRLSFLGIFKPKSFWYLLLPSCPSLQLLRPLPLVLLVTLLALHFLPLLPFLPLLLLSLLLLLVLLVLLLLEEGDQERIQHLLGLKVLTHK